MNQPNLPKNARVVVVGGGIIGCSVAYHLADMGWKDIVLLERGQLTSGTTWHAAGLMVTFGSTSETSTEMRKYTRDLYFRLEKETGQPTGMNAIGFIQVATDQEVQHLIRQAKLFGTGIGYIDAHLLASTRLTVGALLWTRDKRLSAASVNLGLNVQTLH